MSKSGRKKNTVPIFLNKLIEMLEDQCCHEYIRWTEQEDGFAITKITSFTEHILPKYFKHQNISSFIRQLNMYGFTKTRSNDCEHIYHNENFKRGNRNALKKVQRKLPKNDNETENQMTHEKDCLSQKQMRDFMELKEKQRFLQEKFRLLLQKNADLMQQNIQITQGLKQQQKSTTQLFQIMQQMLSRTPSENNLKSTENGQSQKQEILCLENGQKQRKNQKETQAGDQLQQNFQEQFPLTMGEQGKISVAQILGNREDFLSINDFCNIPEDSFSHQIHFQ